MEVLEYITDLIVAIVIIFIFPIMYFGLKQDTLIYVLVKVETKSFVDEIRSQGYLTSEMYEEYTKKLSTTGIIYNISMEHKQVIYEPEYVFQTPEPVFSGNVMEYIDINYHEEIINRLYKKEGIYYFSEMDYFKVHVKNITAGMGRHMLTYIHDYLDETFINFNYGGYIREDGND